MPECFTKTFHSAASFKLLNNNFQFDSYVILQLVGPAMGTKFAPPYACLSVGYLEETILFPQLLPLYFTLTECKLIEEIFKHFMDDSFVYGQKMLILMYLESFSMSYNLNYIPHCNLQ